MRQLIYRVGILSSFILLSACSGGGDPSGNENMTTDLSVKMADGNSIVLTGTFNTDCYSTDYTNDGVQDGVKESIAFVDDNMTYTTNIYAADTACSGIPDVKTMSLIVSIDSDVNATSWVNGNGDSVSPPSVISPSAEYTLLTGAVFQSDIAGVTAGMNVDLGYVVDNFTSPDGMTLYRLDDALLGVVTTADPYTNIVTPPPGPAAGPDLQISINPVENTEFNNALVSYRVTNVGDTDSGAFVVMMWVDSATAPDYSSAQSGQFHPIANLTPGESVGYGKFIGATITPGASYNAYVIADFLGAVIEADEGLTGVSDNLSHDAWTAGDIFYLSPNFYNDTNEVAAVDSTHESDISAYYDAVSAVSFIKLESGYQPGNLPAEMYEIRLTTEFTPGVYSDTGVLYYFTATLNGQFYTMFPSSGSTLTITSAGAAGELVTGSLDVNLCPGSEVTYTGLLTASCNVAVTNYIGSFSFIRDADQ